MKPVVAITVGDYNGIGPEIILKSISRRAIHRTCTPILVGPASAFLFYARRLKLKVELLPVSIDYKDAHDIKQTLAYRRSPVLLIPLVESSQLPRSAISPGKTSAKAGNAAARAIEEAVCLAKAGIARAIVTAPVSKKAMHRARVNFPGQTEMLQHLTGSPRVAMMLVSRTMRVGLVTIHVPIRKIPKTLSRQLVRERIKTIHEALITDWRIRKPKVAVLGLNPHAGEEGDLGTEDKILIKPVIKQMRATNMNVDGPFPADSFFGSYAPGRFDAIIAMYHDQGLIPLKMSSFGKGVNVSVGLPIVRTSPDHGTAFDIAGKGIANPGSMIEAIKLAAQIAKNRGLTTNNKRSDGSGSQSRKLHRRTKK
ncbi:MAG: 4-hydroxythreonine-4-phosphate dehydrogenase PdxA [Ignavibacteria bacterium]|nr:4-hydroxythreonine-4-phosphate dehydrogenase PdxA [Ignavibacteria bacterium]